MQGWSARLQIPHAAARVSVGLVAIVLASCTASPARASDLFTAPYRVYFAPHGDYALTAADVNSDSKLDLVTDQGYLPGNGDGTFQPMSTFSGANSGLVAVADVNRDGYPDVVSVESNGSPLVLRSTRIEEIYALDLKLP